MATLVTDGPMRGGGDSRLLLSRKIALLLLLVFLSPSAFGCTIFVLTDAEQVLFCNNEDWSNPKTRLWFVPGGKGYYGCAYVGFDEGWGQGGLNTEGLAYDWVAGFRGEWTPGSEQRPIWGNPAQRMLETCGSVEEAIAFFQKHRETGFQTGRILVADKTGASVIMGARNGNFFAEKAQQCRGFGYGGGTLQRLLARQPKVSVSSGINILRACTQKGQYATKYANLFDLKSGDIFVYPAGGPREGVQLNLHRELKKGGHYYDLPQLSQQLKEPLQPLRREMQRFALGDFRPAAAGGTRTEQRIRKLLQDSMAGRMEEKDYHPELWKEMKPKEVRAELEALGELVSLAPVEMDSKSGPGEHLYRLEFTKAIVVQEFRLDEQGRLKGSATKFFQGKE